MPASDLKRKSGFHHFIFYSSQCLFLKTVALEKWPTSANALGPLSHLRQNKQSDSISGSEQFLSAEVQSVQ